MILIIDGYNLLFSGLYRAYARPSGRSKVPKTEYFLETARDKLITCLKQYNQSRKAGQYKIVVVFDNSTEREIYPSQKESSGIRIIFASPTADDTILNIAESYITNSSSLEVVTSDRDLRERLAVLGVKTIPVTEFIKDLFREPPSGNCGDETTCKESGEPAEKFRRLSPSEVEKWLKVFRND
ncbi:MAG: NYN domain-containing protein [Planctomycetota bacterium]|nr:NYN domain-containing protein [Planctomycetota bacterium]MDI6787406.1 NYN domain-containing protein [Planctomycetota bacterium]